MISKSLNQCDLPSILNIRYILNRIFLLGGILFLSIVWVNLACAVIYVDKDRPGGSGTSWADAYNSIEAAISGVLLDNQEFWVAEGTYTPSATLYPRHGSKFYGGFAGNETDRSSRDINAHPAIIDGQNSLIHIIFIGWETAEVRLDGFTIKRGSATVDDGSWGKYGGAIFIDFFNLAGDSNIIMANCKFTENTSETMGGAVFVNRRAATFESCEFQNNSSTDGGGLAGYDSDITVTDSLFGSNHANRGAQPRGGAIFIGLKAPQISNCTFSGNTAGWSGGAIELSATQNALVSNCSFLNNSATKAGGGFSVTSQVGPLAATVDKCSFQNNSGEGGGGIYSFYAHLIISGSTFQGNTANDGGAILLDYTHAIPSRVEGCFFTNNSAAVVGGAIRSYARRVEIDNSVFTFNSSLNAGAVGFHAGVDADFDAAFTATVRNSSFYGNSATEYGGAILNSFAYMVNIYNSIFWGNQGTQEVWDPAQGKNVGTHDVFNAGSSSMTTRYTDMETLSWEHASVTESHTGSFSSNPMFLDPDGVDNTQGTLDDNLRLKIGSPCIDRADGDNAAASDIESTARYDVPFKPNIGTGTPDYGDLGPYESTDNLVIVPQISSLLDE